MLKLDFNTIVPYPQRNKLIHSFQDLGFVYEHVFSNDTYSIHKLTGKFPSEKNYSKLNVVFEDEKTKECFLNCLCGTVEIIFYSERKQDYDNKM